MLEGYLGRRSSALDEPLYRLSVTGSNPTLSATAPWFPRLCWLFLIPGYKCGFKADGRALFQQVSKACA